MAIFKAIISSVRLI